MKLYKKDTKGNIRYIDISYNSDGELIQISGIVGTENPVPHKKQCKGKNIGKSNETTPEEQAKSESESKIKEKLTEGYFKTKEEAEKNLVILPMLAKKYEDESKKIKWDFTSVFIQPKLDGMRCLAFIDKKSNTVKLLSRDGKIIENMSHIEKELLEYFPNQDIILDGELYCHGIGFQGNMRLIKKYRAGETEKIQYNIYDLVNDEDEYYLRKYHIDTLCLKFNKTVISDEKIKNENITVYTETAPKYFKFVATYPIKNEEELKKYHKEFIKDSYEGSIIRIGNGKYKCNGRSSELLKYKQFQDIALKIKDIIPMEVYTNQGTCIFDWKGAKGHIKGDDILGCGMKFSHEEREEFLKNKENYIGKIAELRFFEYSDEGVPRFPVMIGFRLDKNKSDIKNN